MAVTNYFPFKLLKAPKKRSTSSKPTVAATKFKKDTVRGGYKVTMVMKTDGSGKRKAWRKIR